MFKTLSAIAGFAALAFIAFATLSPIGLRPRVASIEYEHIVAFAVMTGLFCVAFPRQAIWVLLAMAAVAICFEIAQLFVPGRHGRVIDAVQKILGACLGYAVAFVVTRFAATAD